MRKTIPIEQILQNTNYEALVKQYKKWLQTLGFSASLTYNYPRFVAYFLHYIEQQKISQITQLQQKNIQLYFKYLEQRLNKKNAQQLLSTSYLNTNFISIDKFLEFLHQMGMNNAPTPTKYTIEHHRKNPLQILTKNEVKILYETIPLTFSEFTFAKREDRQMAVKLVLDLCYGCGMRKSEALNLAIKDINFDTKIIHIKQGKNRKDRYVPMSKEILKSIQNFTYNHRRNFTSKRSQYIYPFKNTAITKTLVFLLKESNNKNLKAKNPTLHTLRHSIATHLLQNGMKIENISVFLGHNSLDSTQLYTHIIDEQF